MLTDIEIAQSAPIRHIREVAAAIGIDKEDLEYLYNKYKKQYDEMSIGEKRREKEKLRKEITEKQKKLVEVTEFLNENDPYELKKNK